MIKFRYAIHKQTKQIIPYDVWRSGYKNNMCFIRDIKD